MLVIHDLRHQEKCDLSSLGAVSDKTQLYIFPLPCASHRVASGFHKINNRLCYSKKILFKFSTEFKNVSLASDAAQTQLKLALQTFFHDTRAAAAATENDRNSL